MDDPTPSAPIGRDPLSALVAWAFSRGGFVALCVAAAGVGMVGMANNDHYQGHHTAMLACAVLTLLLGGIELASAKRRKRYRRTTRAAPPISASL